MIPHDILTLYSAKMLEYGIAVLFLLLFIPFWKYVGARDGPVPRHGGLNFVGLRVDVRTQVDPRAPAGRRLFYVVDVHTEAGLSFPELAQLYEDEKGRQALVQLLRDRLEEGGDEPQPVHHLIAGLTGCDVLVTTNLDQALERAFDRANRPLTVIVGNVDVAFEDERKARLYKLRGSLERPESLVLTEDDYEAFFDDQSSISIVLQGYLARKTILFLGYDLNDPHVKGLYRKVTAPLDGLARRAYAFIEGPSTTVSRWCQRHGIELIQAEAR